MTLEDLESQSDYESDDEDTPFFSTDHTFKENVNGGFRFAKKQSFWLSFIILLGILIGGLSLFFIIPGVGGIATAAVWLTGGTAMLCVGHRRAKVFSLATIVLGCGCCCTLSIIALVPIIIGGVHTLAIVSSVIGLVLAILKKIASILGIA